MTRRNDLENLMKSLIGRLFPKRIARTWAAVLWAATPFWSALPQTPATAAFVEQPAARRAVAWIRFVDAPERYAGTPYYWLGNGDLRLAFSVRPESGQALELHWGAKQDHRQATLVVNGRPLPVEGGGHDGFRWLRVPLPGDLPGDRIELTCVWDNSAENQPWVGGERQPPRRVGWGDGSLDEMCLGGITLSDD